MNAYSRIDGWIKAINLYAFTFQFGAFHPKVYQIYHLKSYLRGILVGSCDHGQKADSAAATAGLPRERKAIIEYINRAGREAIGERGLGKWQHVSDVL